MRSPSTSSPGNDRGSDPEQMITALPLSVWPVYRNGTFQRQRAEPIDNRDLAPLEQSDKPLCRVDTIPLFGLLTARQSAAGYATAPSPIPKSPAWHQEHHSHGSVGPAGGGCAGAYISWPQTPRAISLDRFGALTAAWTCNFSDPVP